MQSDTGSPDWIAVDWGTSRLRAWAMNGDRVLAEARSDRGMGTLTPGAFEPALIELTEGWLNGRASPMPVIACGMVGARQGWVEAPYAAVPCAPLGAAFAKAPANDKRLAVSIIPGLRQDSPADVMRGEETQIAGFLRTDPRFDGVLCLPGTHCKWAHISAGEVVSFRTYMSGELFACLASASVLRHSIPETGWDAAAFAEAVSDGIAKPEALAARLFSLRAEGLLHGLPGETARARLSGLLIGAELAAARPYWLGQRVVIIGDTTLADAYGAALASQGLTPQTMAGDTMTRAGLISAHALWKDPRP